MMQPRPEYIIVNGKRLEIRWHGPPPNQAPTLVFLHEGLGCVAMWRDFPARLAAATGCGAMIYSRLGYGRSDPCDLPRPVRFMHAEGLIVLPQVLDIAKIERCILIGHSDGGSIGIIYAGGTSATPLLGLVTEAAHVFCEEISVHAIEKAREAFLNTDLRSRLAKYHGTNVDCAFWGWNGAWLHPEFIRWNIEAYLPGIRVPTLALQGANDHYGTPAQLASIAHKAGAGAEVVLLSDCAHSPHYEQPEATLQKMKTFVLDILAGKKKVKSF
jgi:pimeloyl-ACP methyl ester carboxylesterase